LLSAASIAAAADVHNSLLADQHGSTVVLMSVIADVQGEVFSLPFLVTLLWSVTAAW
jgi:hypothetical protein